MPLTNHGKLSREALVHRSHGPEVAPDLTGNSWIGPLIQAAINKRTMFSNISACHDNSRIYGLFYVHAPYNFNIVEINFDVFLITFI